MTTKTALITGASGGIGYELARLFARDGYNLVLIARSEGKLAQLAAEVETAATVLPKDLADPASPDQIYAELERQDINVDVLVNNAGFGLFGPFAETELSAELNMMQLNMVTLTHLTKLFLPGMLKRGTGRIINVASTAAFQPGPLMAVYYASKAYVLHFSEALANETRGTGVTVTAFCPGPTESGFQSRADMEDSKLLQRGLMSAAEAARIGYEGAMTGQTIVIPGFQNKLGAFIVRFVPRQLATQIVRRVQESQ